jgi:hypothetical protein
MKSGAKVTRVQLKISQKNESALIGIVSSEPDYKLTLLINRKLKLKLKNESPLAIEVESGPEVSFSRFTDTSSTPDLVFTLISNRSGKNYLLRKIRNIDYIFTIHNPDNEATIKKISADLKETEGITAIFNIDPASLKEKNLHYIIQ